MNTELKPIIGITGYGTSELPASTALYDTFYASPALYAQCVVRAGGIAVLLPPIGSADMALLARLDGIIFSGGGDIDAGSYGGNADHRALQPPDMARDTYELELIRLAVKINSLPILAICRGMQLLNVALGGSLIEHLPDRLEEDIHRNSQGLWTLHDVIVSADSRLSKIMRADQVNTQSGHHQALDKIAPCLNIVARSSDNIVEAVELSSHPWCMAVQWHPEKTAHTDATQQRLFDALVDESTKYHGD